MEPNCHLLEIRALTSEWKEPLLVFFNALTPEDRENFRPHPFTHEAIDQILRNVRYDLYYVTVGGPRILGYGMLRGWDEGFEIPSLGIAIHPSVRGTGIGKALMQFLAAAARHRGVTQIRLRVKSENVRARKLYEGLGYKFTPQEEGYLEGWLSLKHPLFQRAE